MRAWTWGLAVAVIGGVLTFGLLRAFAVGPDVNSDGYVTGVDISRVVAAFGQVMPTATATPPSDDPLEGVWEGINRFGEQDWLLIENETSGVYSVKYYGPYCCFPGRARLGLGGAHFEEEFQRYRWHTIFWQTSESEPPVAMQLRCATPSYTMRHPTL